MKFLVDAHLPRRLAYQLRAFGHEAVHTLDLPRGNRTPDPELGDLSVRDHAIVVTKDADFVNTFTVQRVPYKLLLVSTGNITNAALETLVTQHMAVAARLALRLPEPQDEGKVFRFERVNFFAQGDGEIVDYVSLSDGEHQLAQILGMFGMVSLSNALFLLDEPESHFNPQWRVKFMTRVLDMPTPDGTRRDVSSASQQDCLLTTHAPFVPSDMPRDRVFIFGKDTETGIVTVRNPDIETYGTTFDAIIEECFGVRPPISEEPRQDIDKLHRRTGLYDRLAQYSAAAGKLSVSERQQVLTCLVQQNRIADLVTCATDCESLSDLPKAIQAPVAELFGFAFELLTGLGVRDRHYHAIYTAVPYHVCPFCGCEYFDAPGAPREDLDHYLSKSLYPFAAANLRNLVPMGMKCNERYKLAQDILRDAAGVRRRSFDPYADRQITVILDNSVPFGGADGQTPDWQIDFDPDSIECTTWDNIFHVRERIKRDVLDSSFWQWLRDFSAWFKKRMGIAAPGDAEVLDAMRTYAEDMALTGLTAREFLRAPVFQMLHRHCKAGNQRILALMKDVVAMAVP